VVPEDRSTAYVTKKTAVKLTANFERNLESIELFLLEADATKAFDALLEELTETIIPNLEHFPDMGRLFLNRIARSVEANNGLEALRHKLEIVAKGSELREYLFTDYLELYARAGNTIYLLSIKHHRQLSFDFQSLWFAP